VLRRDQDLALADRQHPTSVNSLVATGSTSGAPRSTSR
jgi:hypothetical protein